MAWEGKVEGGRGAGREIGSSYAEGSRGGRWRPQRSFESLVLSVPGPGCLPACDIPVDLKLIQGNVSHSTGRPI